jgi:hypothetical protein
VVVSFIGGGNRCTRKKTHQPLASHFYKKTSLVVTAGFQTVRKKFEDTKGGNQKPLMDG